MLRQFLCQEIIMYLEAVPVSRDISLVKLRLLHPLHGLHA